MNESNAQQQQQHSADAQRGSTGRGHHQIGATCTASVPKELSLVPDIIYGTGNTRKSAYQVITY